MSLFSKMLKNQDKQPLYVDKELTFSIENVRCFAQKQDIKIRPLTFLMGANSAGKTTVLSCFTAASHLKTGFPPEFAWDFNRTPYEMGYFRDICRRDADNFTLGLKVGSQDHRWRFKTPPEKTGAGPHLDKETVRIHVENKHIQATIKSKNGSPLPSVKIESPSLKIDMDEKDLTAQFSVDNQTQTFTIPREKITRHLSEDLPHRQPLHLRWIELMRFVRIHIRRSVSTEASDNSKFIRQLSQTVRDIEDHSFYNRRYPLGFGPVRAKPKRTYDVVMEEFDPEGAHAPVRLLRLTEKTGWAKVQKQLEDFGKAAGLFSKIEVKKYGDVAGEPFQIHFVVNNMKSNIIDTGYGISQILPLLTHIFADAYAYNHAKEKKPTKKRYLVQQPEVHLHPQARAELSSLLIHSINTHDNAFIVETHSDFMLDRASVAIRKQQIKPSDVMLVYLDNTPDGTKVHNIEFDKDGNLTNTPEGYKEFFVHEANRVLGFEG